MDATTRTRLIQQAARAMRYDALAGTDEDIARWSEWANVGQVTSMSDTSFARFARAVRRELAAMAQEDADTARVLGR